jgi:hypothetical protein
MGGEKVVLLHWYLSGMLPFDTMDDSDFVAEKRRER